VIYRVIFLFFKITFENLYFVCVMQYELITFAFFAVGGCYVIILCNRGVVNVDFARYVCLLVILYELSF